MAKMRWVLCSAHHDPVKVLCLGVTIQDEASHKSSRHSDTVSFLSSVEYKHLEQVLPGNAAPLFFSKVLTYCNSGRFEAFHIVGL